MFRKHMILMVLTALALGFRLDLNACSVPVFRYALERWERDEYRLIIAAPGKLNDELAKAAEDLKKQNFYEEGFCNLGVYVLDTSDKETNKDVFEKYPDLEKVTEPTAFLLYPRGSYLPTIVYKEPFTKNTGEKLIASESIKEVTLEILKGTSAVWLMVDSGNKAEDDKAFEIIKKKLEQLSKDVEMPAGVIETSGNITGGMAEEEVMANYDPANFLRSGIPFKIGFHVIRLPKDRKESILRSMLMNIEEDLHEYKDKPMVFPVFGRGRFLVPMIGEGINDENIEMATSYLCGACSCQVKNQNPGVDLLTNTDWYSYLEGSEVVVDKELPPLTGTADLAEAVEEKPEDAVEDVVEDVVEQPSNVTRNLLIMLGATLLVIGGVSVMMAKKD